MGLVQGFYTVRNLFMQQPLSNPSACRENQQPEQAQNSIETSRIYPKSHNKRLERLKGRMGNLPEREMRLRDLEALIASERERIAT